MKFSKINLFIFFFIILFFLYYLISIQIKPFENKYIISKLDHTAGFYSQLFFLINHYIYCKENKQNFKINSVNWIYRSKEGWTDYFKPIELKYSVSNSDNKTYGHKNIIDNYSIESYKKAIPEIYVYNQSIKNHIANIKKQLNLINYDAIYIRRGDKLVDEIKISQESTYIELLLKKNPNCKTIFLQTDDYTCFINLQKYIKDNRLNIRLVTTCNKNSVGAITNNYYKQNLDHSFEENSHYISSIRDKLQKTKCIEDMNSKEKYEHTLELLTGIDICIHSNICICDYSSNVSRFIKLAHNNTNRVFDINNTNVDLSKKICPAYSF
jgi:hypothetical protein